MNKTRRVAVICSTILVGILLAWSCQSDQDEFRKTPDGLTYKFHEQHNDAGVVLPGDLITANVVFRTPDTLFFVSSGDLTVPYQFEVLEPRFGGDIYDALLLMKVGDSATFIIKGDSLFLFDFEVQELPDFIDENTRVYMDIKLLDIMPREAFEKEKKSYGNRVEKIVQEFREREQSDIRTYLEQHNITVNPSESGLYFIETESGSGPAVEPGKRVRVDYSAMFINGEIFETTKRDVAMKYNIFDTVKNYRPFEYIHGDSLTIAGWDEGLSYMREGGKAWLIMTSALAYGEEGVEGYIPPYTPLIYEIEVLEVK